MSKQLKAVIFDLDGVITNTEQYHFLAWKHLANSLGIDYDKKTNEHLKGIGRMESLEKILKLAEIQFSDAKKLELANQKNEHYKNLIKNISKEDILPGIINLLNELKANNIKFALASASRNATAIIERLGLQNDLDVIVDVKKIKKGKPNPEIFLKGAELLQAPVQACIGIEDAASGVEAIKAAKMFAVGIGSKKTLHRADYIVETTAELKFSEMKKRFLEGS